MAKRVNYDEMTVTCNGWPSHELWVKFYCQMIDFFVEAYGKDAVRIALEEVVADIKKEKERGKKECCQLA